MSFAERVNAQREQIRQDAENAATLAGVQAEEEARQLEIRRVKGERVARIAKVLADTLLALPESGPKQRLYLPGHEEGRWEYSETGRWRRRQQRTWNPGNPHFADTWVLESTVQRREPRYHGEMVCSRLITDYAERLPSYREYFTPSYGATSLATDGSVYRVACKEIPRSGPTDYSEPSVLSFNEYGDCNPIYLRQGRHGVQKLEAVDLDETIEQTLLDYVVRREEIDPAIFATLE